MCPSPVTAAQPSRRTLTYAAFVCNLSRAKKRWQRRYFVVAGHYLKYYEDEGSQKNTKGVSDLSDLQEIIKVCSIVGFFFFCFVSFFSCVVVYFLSISLSVCVFVCVCLCQYLFVVCVCVCACGCFPLCARMRVIFDFLMFLFFVCVSVFQSFSTFARSLLSSLGFSTVYRCLLCR